MSSVELEIRRLGPLGDGIAQSRFGSVFVDRTLPGEVVRVGIRRDRKGNLRGHLKRILKPSLLRQEPPCPLYSRCGGCTLQHLQEKTYREWKVGVVKEALMRVNLSPQEWRPPFFIGQNQRRRVTFTAARQGSDVKVGYYGRRTSEVEDISQCLVTMPEIMELQKEIKASLGPHLSLEPIDVSLQYLGGNSLKFGSLSVKIPPGAFIQATSQGERVLQEDLLSAIPLSGRFADLFSGCGTFSGVLLDRGEVDAYESDLQSVRALSEAGIERELRVFRRDLYRDPLRRNELNRYDAVVIDPPRSGCLEQVVELSSARVPIVVSISCNPATFARDAAVLSEGGYRLRWIRVVDQFLWSHHVEVIGLFEKSLPKRR